MFSAAVSSPSRLGSWNTMPKARRTSSGSLTGSWPAIESRPSLGASTVVSILIVVVLPAPLGPRNPKMTALRHRERDVVDRGEAVEALDEIAGLDDRGHHLLSTNSPVLAVHSFSSNCFRADRGVGAGVRWYAAAAIGAQSPRHGSEECVQIVRLCPSELSDEGTLVHFPGRGARLACRQHLVGIDIHYVWTIRRRSS